MIEKQGKKQKKSQPTICETCGIDISESLFHCRKLSCGGASNCFGQKLFNHVRDRHHSAPQKGPECQQCGEPFVKRFSEHHCQFPGCGKILVCFRQVKDLQRHQKDVHAFMQVQQSESSQFHSQQSQQDQISGPEPAGQGVDEDFIEIQIDQIHNNQFSTSSTPIFTTSNTSLLSNNPSTDSTSHTNLSHRLPLQTAPLQWEDCTEDFSKSATRAPGDKNVVEIVEIVDTDEHDLSAFNHPSKKNANNNEDSESENEVVAGSDDEQSQNQSDEHQHEQEELEIGDEGNEHTLQQVVNETATLSESSNTNNNNDNSLELDDETVLDILVAHVNTFIDPSLISEQQFEQLWTDICREFKPRFPNFFEVYSSTPLSRLLVKSYIMNNGLQRISLDDLQNQHPDGIVSEELPTDVEAREFAQIYSIDVPEGGGGKKWKRDITAVVQFAIARAHSARAVVAHLLHQGDLNRYFLQFANQFAEKKFSELFSLFKSLQEKVSQSALTHLIPDAAIKHIRSDLLLVENTNKTTNANSRELPQPFRDEPAQQQILQIINQLIKTNHRKVGFGFFTDVAKLLHANFVQMLLFLIHLTGPSTANKCTSDL